MHSRLVDFLENIFEAAVVFLQNGVLGRHELQQGFISQQNPNSRP